MPLTKRHGVVNDQVFILTNTQTCLDLGLGPPVRFRTLGSNSTPRYFFQYHGLRMFEGPPCYIVSSMICLSSLAVNTIDSKQYLIIEMTNFCRGFLFFTRGAWTVTRLQNVEWDVKLYYTILTPAWVQIPGLVG